MQTPPPLPVLAPAAERDAGLDAARGFAVLGLIFCNIPGFASTEQYRAWFDMAKPLTGWPAAGDFLIELFLAGKCVTILSFLLGAGLALQYRRAVAAGQSFARLTVRRMSALLIIGILHIIFLWWGDILCAYAILGFGLLPLYRLPAPTHRWIAVGTIGGTFILSAAVAFLPGTGGDPDPEHAAYTEKMLRFVEETYRSGAFPMLILVRIIEAVLIQVMMVFFLPMYLGVVLLGFDAIRSGWLPWKGQTVRPSLIAGLAAIGIGLSAVAAWATVTDPAGNRTFLLFVLAGMPGTFALAAAYLWGLLRLPDGLLRRALAAVGRTALSNYLLQSFCAALVFQSWGFGLFGQLTFAQTLQVAVGIVLLQIVWSALWLKYFQFGPMESLWRRMAYGRPIAPPRIPAEVLSTD